jgi:hypothetical protein
MPFVEVEITAFKKMFKWYPSACRHRPTQHSMFPSVVANMAERTAGISTRVSRQNVTNFNAFCNHVISTFTEVCTHKIIVLFIIIDSVTPPNESPCILCY